MGRPPHRARQGLRRRPHRRRDPRDPRHADGAGHATRPSASGPWRRTSTCSRGCAPASSRTAPACCARRSTWPRPTSTCATPCCTGSCTPRHPRTGDAWCIYPTYDYAHGQSRCHRGRHPLAVHPRVRRPPAPLRLAASRTCRSRRARTSTSSRGSTSPTSCCPSGSCSSSSTTGACAAGTIPGCPRSRACAGAASPPRASATSPAMSASPRTTASTSSAMLEHAIRSVLNRTPARRFARPRPGQGGHRELPRGPGRADGGRQQPRGPVRRDAAGGVLARAVDRARRLHGGAGAQVLPALARARGAAAQRVLRHLPVGGQGCRGRVVELRCTYDPATRGGDSPDGRRPKATLHWVSAAHAIPAEVRLYDQLFSRPDPGADGGTSSTTSTRSPRRC